jgi:hypothetical protein
MAKAMLDFPDLGGPFSTTICPGSTISLSHRKLRVFVTYRAIGSGII